MVLFFKQQYFCIVFMMVFSIVTTSATSLIPLDEQAGLHKACYEAALHDDTELMRFGKEESLRYLLTPRKDCTRFDPTLITSATKTITSRLTLTEENIDFAPWTSLSAHILAKVREGAECPLAEVFALGYIRGIPGWMEVFDRLFTEKARLELARLSIQEE